MASDAPACRPSPPRSDDADRAARGLREAARVLLERGNRCRHEGLDLGTGSGQRHAAALPCARLEHAYGELLLALESEQGDSPLGDAHWQDYEGEARLLAWSLAHEALLDALCRLFGGALLPVALLTAGVPDRLWLTLAFDDGAGGRLQGWLGLGTAEARRLADSPLWRRDPARWSLLGDVEAVLLQLRLQGRPLAPETAASLQTGDVLLLGDEHDLQARLRPDPAMDGQLFGLPPQGWAVRRAQGRWTIAEEAALASALDPQRPHFTLARLSLAPAQLAALGPGSVLTWDAALPGCAADIELQGRRLGAGEVVTLGGLLGVRIGELADGFQ